MKRCMKIIFITGVIISILCMGEEMNEVFAAKHAAPPGPGLSPPRYTPPHFHQPMVPPGFPYKWISAEVVESFEDNQLAVKVTETVTEHDYKNMPAKAEEGIKFSFPMLDESKKGCILSFDKKNDMYKLKKYFLDRNNEGD
jgi:hypothetical protein